MAYPPKNKCGELSSLVDDDLCESISDFCFPSGVRVEKINYDFEKDLMSQSKEVRELLEEIIYK